jgi:sialate O-acetylesterase
MGHWWLLHFRKETAMRRWVWWALLFGGVMVSGADRAAAAVKTPAVIGNGMVLQRGMEVPVWGTADPGEQVTVHFQDQEVSATAKPDGRWAVRFKKLKAGGPFEMVIQGKNKLVLKDVLVGEVWVCSGQSNMEMQLQACTGAPDTIRDSTNPKIRLFTVAHAYVPKPATDVKVVRPVAAIEDKGRVNLAGDVKGIWLPCGPRTVPGFSAVAYYFGRDLQKKLKVPVGLIHTSVGGTPAEFWTSAEALAANRALKGLRGSGLYNGMIAPLIPYAIRGAIWYQGESNAGGPVRARQYETLFPTMIEDWRARWHQGDFPFLFVQIAPWRIPPAKDKAGKPVPNVAAQQGWPALREAQRLTLKKVPNTAMAVITDVGDANDIHPRNKAPVGDRLAREALALAYGEKIEYSGPAYAAMRVEGDRGIIQFDHLGGGLVAKGGPLTGFTIAGEDGKFVPAKAEIRGDEVVVRSPEVKHPAAVRYGWSDNPEVNLWNKAGLPASPFRTDTFALK